MTAFEATSAQRYDVLVIGAGFGGLGAALTLAEQGARVCLCETLRYPGGCASTFTKNGYRFDAGATLLGGLDASQLFGRWLAKYAPATRVDWIDEPLELRSTPLMLRIARSREQVVEAFANLPGAPPGVRAFFEEQRTVADTLWPLLDEPDLLPPFTLRALARHTSRLARYATLVRRLGQPLESVMRSHGVADFAPLRLYVDALCQITVQCAASEAEAPLALSALDYLQRGAAHVHGGVGVLAEALLGAARKLGVDVHMPNRVINLRYDPRRGFVATTRHGLIHARGVVANVLPRALDQLLGEASNAWSALPPLRATNETIEHAWGAAMLYAVANAPREAPLEAMHLQLVDDASAPLTEGNHVFLSISAHDEIERAPLGKRTLTASTHVPLQDLRRTPDPGPYIANIQARMLQTLRRRAPEWAAAITWSATASPRTFERFVSRPFGAVGGAPRRAGLHNYANIGPLEARPHLWLVGDSVFPGQSALATAVGGSRTALAIVKRL